MQQTTRNGVSKAEIEDAWRNLDEDFWGLVEDPYVPVRFLLGCILREQVKLRARIDTLTLLPNTSANEETGQPVVGADRGADGSEANQTAYDLELLRAQCRHQLRINGRLKSVIQQTSRDSHARTLWTFGWPDLEQSPEFERDIE